MIKNIIFDMGNVLLAYTPNKYMKTITEDEVIIEVVLKELFYAKEWQDLDGGYITEEIAVANASKRAPKYSKYIEKAMENWHSDLTPIEGMAEIISKLKEKGYKIYLLSNTSLRFFNYKDKVDIFKNFDGFIISAKEKLLKPDKAIFECICNRYSLNKEECIFVDDLKANIEGAESFGIKGHLFSEAEGLQRYLEAENIL